MRFGAETAQGFFIAWDFSALPIMLGSGYVLSSTVWSAPFIDHTRTKKQSPTRFVVRGLSLNKQESPHERNELQRLCRPN